MQRVPGPPQGGMSADRHDHLDDPLEATGTSVRKRRLRAGGVNHLGLVEAPGAYVSARLPEMSPQHLQARHPNATDEAAPQPTTPTDGPLSLNATTRTNYFSVVRSHHNDHDRSATSAGSHMGSVVSHAVRPSVAIADADGHIHCPLCEATVFGEKAFRQHTVGCRLEHGIDPLLSMVVLRRRSGGSVEGAEGGGAGGRRASSARRQWQHPAPVVVPPSARRRILCSLDTVNNDAMDDAAIGHDDTAAHAHTARHSTFLPAVRGATGSQRQQQLALLAQAADGNGCEMPRSFNDRPLTSALLFRGREPPRPPREQRPIVSRLVASSCAEMSAAPPVTSARAAADAAAQEARMHGGPEATAAEWLHGASTTVSMYKATVTHEVADRLLRCLDPTDPGSVRYHIVDLRGAVFTSRDVVAKVARAIKTAPVVHEVLLDPADEDEATWETTLAGTRRAQQLAQAQQRDRYSEVTRVGRVTLRALDPELGHRRSRCAAECARAEFGCVVRHLRDVELGAARVANGIFEAEFDARRELHLEEFKAHVDLVRWRRRDMERLDAAQQQQRLVAVHRDQRIAFFRNELAERQLIDAELLDAACGHFATSEGYGRSVLLQAFMAERVQLRAQERRLIFDARARQLARWDDEAARRVQMARDEITARRRVEEHYVVGRRILLKQQQRGAAFTAWLEAQRRQRQRLADSEAHVRAAVMQDEATIFAAARERLATICRGVRVRDANQREQLEGREEKIRAYFCGLMTSLLEMAAEQAQLKASLITFSRLKAEPLAQRRLELLHQTPHVQWSPKYQPCPPLLALTQHPPPSQTDTGPGFFVPPPPPPPDVRLAPASIITVGLPKDWGTQMAELEKKLQRAVDTERALVTAYIEFVQRCLTPMRCIEEVLFGAAHDAELWVDTFAHIRQQTEQQRSRSSHAGASSPLLQGRAADFDGTATTTTATTTIAARLGFAADDFDVQVADECANALAYRCLWADSVPVAEIQRDKCHIWGLTATVSLADDAAPGAGASYTSWVTSVLLHSAEGWLARVPNGYTITAVADDVTVPLYVDQVTALTPYAVLSATKAKKFGVTTPQMDASDEIAYAVPQDMSRSGSPSVLSIEPPMGRDTTSILRPDMTSTLGPHFGAVYRDGMGTVTVAAARTLSLRVGLKNGNGGAGCGSHSLSPSLVADIVRSFGLGAAAASQPSSRGTIEAHVRQVALTVAASFRRDAIYGHPTAAAFASGSAGTAGSGTFASPEPSLRRVPSRATLPRTVSTLVAGLMTSIRESQEYMPLQPEPLPDGGASVVTCSGALPAAIGPSAFTVAPVSSAPVVVAEDGTLAPKERLYIEKQAEDLPLVPLTLQSVAHANLGFLRLEAPSVGATNANEGSSSTAATAGGIDAAHSIAGCEWVLDGPAPLAGAAITLVLVNNAASVDDRFAIREDLQVQATIRDGATSNVDTISLRGTPIAVLEAGLLQPTHRISGPVNGLDKLAEVCTGTIADAAGSDAPFMVRQTRSETELQYCRRQLAAIRRFGRRPFVTLRLLSGVESVAGGAEAAVMAILSHLTYQCHPQAAIIEGVRRVRLQLQTPQNGIHKLEGTFEVQPLDVPTELRIAHPVVTFRQPTTVIPKEVFRPHYPSIYAPIGFDAIVYDTDTDRFSGGSLRVTLEGGGAVANTTNGEGGGAPMVSATACGVALIADPRLLYPTAAALGNALQPRLRVGEGGRRHTTDTTLTDAVSILSSFRMAGGSLRPDTAGSGETASSAAPVTPIWVDGRVVAYLTKGPVIYSSGDEAALGLADSSHSNELVFALAEHDECSISAVQEILRHCALFATAAGTASGPPAWSPKAHVKALGAKRHVTVAGVIGNGEQACNIEAMVTVVPGPPLLSAIEKSSTVEYKTDGPGPVQVGLLDVAVAGMSGGPASYNGGWICAYVAEGAELLGGDLLSLRLDDADLQVGDILPAVPIASASVSPSREARGGKAAVAGANPNVMVVPAAVAQALARGAGGFSWADVCGFTNIMSAGGNATTAQLQLRHPKGTSLDRTSTTVPVPQGLYSQGALVGIVQSVPASGALLIQFLPEKPNVTPVVTRRAVLKLLRALQYRVAPNVEAQFLHKTIRVCVADAPGATPSHSVVLVRVQRPDDVTEVAVRAEKIRVVQGAPMGAQPLMPLGHARLIDADTDVFNGGYLSVQTVTGAVRGDNFCFVLPTAPADGTDASPAADVVGDGSLRHDRYANTTDFAGWSYEEDSGIIRDGEGNALGTVTVKARDGTATELRINFDAGGGVEEGAPVRTVTLGMASVMLNGICFYHTAADRVGGRASTRTMQVRVRDVNNPIEGKLKLDIEVVPPPLFCTLALPPRGSTSRPRDDPAAAEAEAAAAPTDEPPVATAAPAPTAYPTYTFSAVAPAVTAAQVARRAGLQLGRLVQSQWDRMTPADATYSLSAYVYLEVPDAVNGTPMETIVPWIGFASPSLAGGCNFIPEAAGAAESEFWALPEAAAPPAATANDGSNTKNVKVPKRPQAAPPRDTRRGRNVNDASSLPPSLSVAVDSSIVAAPPAPLPLLPAGTPLQYTGRVMNSKGTDLLARLFRAGDAGNGDGQQQQQYFGACSLRWGLLPDAEAEAVGVAGGSLSAVGGAASKPIVQSILKGLCLRVTDDAGLPVRVPSGCRAQVYLSASENEIVRSAVWITVDILPDG